MMVALNASQLVQEWPTLKEHKARLLKWFDVLELELAVAMVRVRARARARARARVRPTTAVWRTRTPRRS